VTSAIGVGSGSRQRAAALAVGVRELGAAAALLARPSSVFLWGRVTGDAVDLAMLTRALLRHDGRGRNRTVAALAGVAGIAAVDVYAAARRSAKESSVELSATTTIRRSPQEIYDFWRGLEHLSEFLAHVDEVRTTGERTSHWRVSAPFGRTVEWDAEVTEDVPGQRLCWRSTGDADVRNEGELRLEPAPRDQGTEVRVRIAYDIPGGKLGQAVARYFGEEPHQQLDDDLRRLKQVLETGEIVRSDGAPSGKRARKEFPQRPARPLSDEEAKEALA
jgi:uncharacterized membrane protein